MTNPEYPVPDRSNYVPNPSKSPENDQVDIGWNEGTLSDGRPFRMECWAQDQVTMLTIFMSARGIEDVDDAFFADLLEREGLVRFQPGRRYVSAARWHDVAGNDLWSVNVVVGDDEGVFVSDSLPLRKYAAP